MSVCKQTSFESYREFLGDLESFTGTEPKDVQISGFDDSYFLTFLFNFFSFIKSM